MENPTNQRLYQLITYLSVWLESLLEETNSKAAKILVYK